jgi:hypothetical protein
MTSLVRLRDQVLIAPKQLQTLVGNRKDGDTVEVTFYGKDNSKRQRSDPCDSSRW